MSDELSDSDRQSARFRAVFAPELLRNEWSGNNQAVEIDTALEPLQHFHKRSDNSPARALAPANGHRHEFTGAVRLIHACFAGIRARLGNGAAETRLPGTISA